MTAETILRLALFAAGLGVLVTAVLALARKKMTETLCLTWGFMALLLMLAGLLLHPTTWNRYLSGEALALIGLGVACLLAVAYFISVGVSGSLRKMNETAIQLAILRFEHSRPAVWDAERKDLLVIIPAYNEEQNLPGLLLRLEEAGVYDFADILVVDDGSSDQTCRRAEDMGCMCISAIFNQGYGSALQTGYKYAVQQKYPYVIQMDADGQHDVCNIEALYRALRETDGEGRRPDLVLGSRFLPGSQSFPIPWVKSAAIWMFRMILLAASGQRITDPTTGLQGLGGRTLVFYSRYGCFDDKYPDANTILQMLLRGYRVREIPAVMHDRTTGTSMHSGLKPLVYMFRMAFSLSAVYIREKLLLKERVSDDEYVEQDIPAKIK